MKKKNCWTNSAPSTVINTRGDFGLQCTDKEVEVSLIMYFSSTKSRMKDTIQSGRIEKKGDSSKISKLKVMNEIKIFLCQAPE